MAKRCVVYDRVNRELRTVVEFFSSRSEAVVLISWRAAMKAGASLAEGATVAEIRWDDGTSEGIQAPAGCAGVVAWTNRKIAYEDLHVSPSQVLLRIEPSGP